MPMYQEKPREFNEMIKGFYARLENNNEKYVPIGKIDKIKDIDEMKDYKREGENDMLKSYRFNPGTYFPGYTFNFKNGEYIYVISDNDLSKYTEKFMDSLKRRSAGILLPKIEKVIFNDPATIVFWEDGTKTVVHAKNEPFDKEKGLAMAISKKAYGNNYGYYNIFKKNGATSKDVKSDAQDS